MKTSDDSSSSENTTPAPQRRRGAITPDNLEALAVAFQRSFEALIARSSESAPDAGQATNLVHFQQKASFDYFKFKQALSSAQIDEDTYFETINPSLDKLLADNSDLFTGLTSLRHLTSFSTDHGNTVTVLAPDSCYTSLISANILRRTSSATASDRDSFELDSPLFLDSSRLSELPAGCHQHVSQLYFGDSRLTVMHLAALQGDSFVVDTWLTHVPSLAFTPDASGETPLHGILRYVEHYSAAAKAAGAHASYSPDEIFRLMAVAKLLVQRCHDKGILDIPDADGVTPNDLRLTLIDKGYILKEHFPVPRDVLTPESTTPAAKRRADAIAARTERIREQHTTAPPSIGSPPSRQEQQRTRHTEETLHEKLQALQVELEKLSFDDQAAIDALWKRIRLADGTPGSQDFHNRGYAGLTDLVVNNAAFRYGLTSIPEGSTNPFNNSDLRKLLTRIYDMTTEAKLIQRAEVDADGHRQDIVGKPTIQAFAQAQDRWPTDRNNIPLMPPTFQQYVRIAETNWLRTLERLQAIADPAGGHSEKDQQYAAQMRNVLLRMLIVSHDYTVVSSDNPDGERIPACMANAMGGRVIVELPDGQHGNFWEWFIGGKESERIHHQSTKLHNYSDGESAYRSSTAESCTPIYKRETSTHTVEKGAEGAWIEKKGVALGIAKKFGVRNNDFGMNAPINPLSPSADHETDTSPPLGQYVSGDYGTLLFYSTVLKKGEGKGAVMLGAENVAFGHHAPKEEGVQSADHNLLGVPNPTSVFGVPKLKYVRRHAQAHQAGSFDQAYALPVEELGDMRAPLLPEDVQALQAITDTRLADEYLTVDGDGHVVLDEDKVRGLLLGKVGHKQVNRSRVKDTVADVISLTVNTLTQYWNADGTLREAIVFENGERVDPPSDKWQTPMLIHRLITEKINAFPCEILADGTRSGAEVALGIAFDIMSPIQQHFTADNAPAITPPSITPVESISLDTYQRSIADAIAMVQSVLVRGNVSAFQERAESLRRKGTVRQGLEEEGSPAHPFGATAATPQVPGTFPFTEIKEISAPTVVSDTTDHSSLSTRAQQKKRLDARKRITGFYGENRASEAAAHRPTDPGTKLTGASAAPHSKGPQSLNPSNTLM